MAGEWGFLELHGRMRLSERSTSSGGLISLGEGQISWAQASNLGDGLSDTGGDRVAGQELPCWGRGAGVLNLGG